jgi:hypothetical protein
VFTSTAGSAFEPAAVLAGSGYRTDLLAADDGLWLISTGGEGSTAVHSADGREWAVDAALELPTEPAAVGILGGRPAVALVGYEEPPGSVTLSLGFLDAAGLSLTDVREALGDLDTETYVPAVAFGPLGFVAVTQSGAPGEATTQVAHTPDGTTFSTTPVPAPAPGRREVVNGVTVSADAVKVRLNARPEGTAGDDELVPVQRLFVGTPRG